MISETVEEPKYSEGKETHSTDNAEVHSKLTIIVNETYSTLVPKMSEAEYTNLKQSIKEQGLLVAIVVNQHGTVLDGTPQVECV